MFFTFLENEVDFYINDKKCLLCLVRFKTPERFYEVWGFTPKTCIWSFIKKFKHFEKADEFISGFKDNYELPEESYELWGD